MNWLESSAERAVCEAPGQPKCGPPACRDGILATIRGFRRPYRNCNMSRRPARFTQAEIARAIAAVKQSGELLTIDVIPDGTIRISPLADASAVFPVKHAPKRLINL
jgi:hypothetical protein